MTLHVCGFNHHTAALAIREQVALCPHLQQQYYYELLAMPGINEVMILSTCNRVEIIYDGDADFSAILNWWSQTKAFSVTALAPHLYYLQEQAAVKHLLSVATGLDSMALGESQILGQIKQAFQQAIDHAAVGSELNRLMQTIFANVKNIRQQTQINRYPVSVSSIALQVAKAHFGKLDHLNILLIGSGETITLILKYLADYALGNLYIANRSAENAKKLTQHHAAKIIEITQINKYIQHSDLVISATACPYPIITLDALNDLVLQPTLMLDLAVPRDIESQVAHHPAVKLYCIDDLNSIISENLAQRQNAAKLAEKMVDEAAEYYKQYLQSLEVVTAIRAYREQSEVVRDQELHMALKQLQLGEAPEQVITRLAHRLTNKLMHKPTMKLREASKAGNAEVIDLMAHLFDFETEMR